MKTTMFFFALLSTCQFVFVSAKAIIFVIFPCITWTSHNLLLQDIIKWTLTNPIIWNHKQYTSTRIFNYLWEPYHHEHFFLLTVFSRKFRDCICCIKHYCPCIYAYPILCCSDKINILTYSVELHGLSFYLTIRYHLIWSKRLFFFNANNTFPLE
jgi:hypothetical protein